MLHVYSTVEMVLKSIDVVLSRRLMLSHNDGHMDTYFMPPIHSIAMTSTCRAAGSHNMQQRTFFFCNLDVIHTLIALQGGPSPRFLRGLIPIDWERLSKRNTGFNAEGSSAI
ncbi:hypothetical protein TWF481_010591 [Arthrobotrys musiformis]|uniref:Uncharacterized protein n=1 Tax=Arthrobotrys musiformis TaxID=47236 RepID=A0AAV9W412_9PEZI